MSWTAIVPLKLGAGRKSRLAAALDAAARQLLAEAMADHVLAQLKRVDEIARIVVLSPAVPPRSDVTWACDAGRGLNAELSALVATLAGDVAIFHGDLPVMSGDDVRALLAAGARAGVALAPDQNGEGTNAIALRADRRLVFAFGPGSLARHLHNAGRAAALVERRGLALDVDELGDLEAARDAGWRR